MRSKEHSGIDQCIDEELSKLKVVYPDGLLGYYYHDARELSRVTHTLKEHLPTVLVFPISDVTCASSQGFQSHQSGLWPADIGTQLGPNFYGVSSLMENMLYKGLDDELIHPDFLFVEQNGNMRKHFPRTFSDITHDQPMTLEGGCLVPIGASHTSVYVPQLSHEYDDVEPIFEENDKELLTCPSVYDWRPSLYHAITRLAIDHPQDWTFANRHIDVLLTGIRDLKTGKDIFYVDEMLWNFLQEQEYASGTEWIPSWMRDASRVSHAAVLKGALNISYIDTEDSTVAVFADSKSMDPRILQMFRDQHIDTCEVGANQVAHKGGPKCRSMRLHWS